MTSAEPRTRGMLKIGVESVRRRYENGVWNTLTVAVLYGGSIIVLMIGEILLARLTSDRVFGEYSLVRQAIPMVCALGLLGYDQALTRETAARRGGVPRVDTHQVRRITAVLLIGMGVGTYLFLRAGTSFLPAAALTVTGAAVAVTNILSGGMRAIGHNARGALAQQGYRLLAGIGLIVLSLLAMGDWGVATLAIGAIFIALWALRWNLTQTTHWVPSSDENRHMGRLGLGYSISLLALSLGDWLDQALVAELSNDLAQVGEYSQAKLLAFYPSLSIGSILGFVALPAIARRRKHLHRVDVVRWMLAGLAASAAISMLVVSGALWATEPLLGKTVDVRALLLLGLVGAVRLYYVLPSAVLGAVGTPAALAQLGAWSLGGIALQVLVTLTLVEPAGILVAAAAGLLASGVTRSIAGSALSLHHSENHRQLTTTDKAR